MSDAKKCDRCGSYYDSHLNREYRLQKDTNKGSTTPTANYQARDLCGECYDALAEWYEDE